jgi:hypothetical protein
MPPLRAQQANRVPLSSVLCLAFFRSAAILRLEIISPNCKNPQGAASNGFGLGTPSLVADSEALRTGFRRKPDSIPMIADSG